MRLFLQNNTVSREHRDSSAIFPTKTGTYPIRIPSKFQSSEAVGGQVPESCQPQLRTPLVPLLMPMIRVPRLKKKIILQSSILKHFTAGGNFATVRGNGDEPRGLQDDRIDLG